MMKILIMSALVFLIAVESTNFDILSVSTCTQQNSNGYCMKWEQNGTVQEQLASCFPGEMRLQTRSGFKTFKELAVGDEVLGYVNGIEDFTLVTGWFHHDEINIIPYLNIYSNESDQYVTVSSKHNLAISQSTYVFAEELTGKTLFGVKGTINQIQVVQAQGEYAPKTRSNNYYVYFEGSQTRKVLAHNYAHIRNPERYENIVDSITAAWEYFDSSKEIVHPSYMWMAKTFKFLIE